MSKVAVKLGAVELTTRDPEWREVLAVAKEQANKIRREINEEET